MVLGAPVDVVLLKRSSSPIGGGGADHVVVLADGGTVGLIVGGVIGTLIWAFFPYKRG